MYKIISNSQYQGSYKRSEWFHKTPSRKEVSFPTNIIDYKYILMDSFKIKVNINE